MNNAEAHMDEIGEYEAQLAEVRLALRAEPSEELKEVEEELESLLKELKKDVPNNESIDSDRSAEVPLNTTTGQAGAETNMLVNEIATSQSIPLISGGSATSEPKLLEEPDSAGVTMSQKERYEEEPTITESRPLNRIHEAHTKPPTSSGALKSKRQHPTRKSTPGKWVPSAPPPQLTTGANEDDELEKNTIQWKSFSRRSGSDKQPVNSNNRGTTARNGVAKRSFLTGASARRSYFPHK